jgi:hypothetical protein
MGAISDINVIMQRLDIIRHTTDKGPHYTGGTVLLLWLCTMYIIQKKEFFVDTNFVQSINIQYYIGWLRTWIFLLTRKSTFFL